MKWLRILIAVSLVVLGAVVLPLAASSVPSNKTRVFNIKARQYAFEPGRIEVNRGDTVRIHLVSLDVVHGFFLEGYDIEALVEPGTPVGKKWQQFKVRRPSQGGPFKVTEEIVFKADRSGKFRFRCSHTCGSMHPFMQGEMIVRPNYPYLAGVGGAAGLLLATLMLLFVWPRPSGPDPASAAQ